MKHLGLNTRSADVLTQAEKGSGTSGTGIAGQSGGTNLRVVRPTTTDNTWQDATQADAPANLRVVAFKDGAGNYIVGASVISGLSGLTAGTGYFLSTAGGLTATPPTPSATVTQLFVGVALSSTTLLFKPGLPVGA